LQIRRQNIPSFCEPEGLSRLQWARSAKSGKSSQNPSSKFTGLEERERFFVDVPLPREKFPSFLNAEIPSGEYFFFLFIHLRERERERASTVFLMGIHSKSGLGFPKSACVRYSISETQKLGFGFRLKSFRTWRVYITPDAFLATGLDVVLFGFTPEGK